MHERARDIGAQHIGRNFDVRGPRFAAIAVCARPRFVEFAQHLFGDARSARIARDGRQNIDVRQILQRSHLHLRARRAAADQQHRHARDRRVRNRGDAVRDARACGHHRDGGLARELRVRVRHVDGRAFVAHVDDANPEPRREIPDRLDVPALEAEDAIDAARHDKARDPGGATALVVAHLGACCEVSVDRLHPR